jgi:hypothetical protein
MKYRYLSKEISTRQEFETEWSGMNNPTEVTLLFHSGGGAGRGNTIAINYKEKEYLPSWQSQP